MNRSIEMGNRENEANSGPANDDLLRFESHRLSTFRHWPPNSKVGAEKIAKAGFFYTGCYSEVKCPWCGCTLATWEYGDQVMGRHRRSQPGCPFVLNVSNNVPMSVSPQPPSQQQQQIIPSQAEESTVPDNRQSVSPARQDEGHTEQQQVNESQQQPEQAQTEQPSVQQQQTPEALQQQQPPEAQQQHQPEDLQQQQPDEMAEPEHEDEQSLGETLIDPNGDGSQLLRHYFCEERRLRTFVGWPVTFVRPVDLAKTGFIYTGSDDIVRCVFCLCYAGSWEESDLPDTVHSELFPQCPFVLGNGCGNRPMTEQRRQEVAAEVAVSGASVGGLDYVGGANDVIHFSNDVTGEVEGVDETGLRGRGRDLNSGPERAGVLTLKDPSKVGQVEELMGVIRHSGPAHPKYATLESRIRTFRDWPPALRQQPADLSASGFYYIGLSDQVKCFYCDGGLRNWQPDDDPWVEHARWFSKCGFIRLVKGDDFIKKCLISKPPEESEIPASAADDRFQMTEETLHAMMSSIEVQEALSRGIDPDRIRKAFRKKWEETGTGFSGSQHLFDALFRNTEFGGGAEDVAPSPPSVSDQQRESQISPTSSSSSSASRNVVTASLDVVVSPTASTAKLPSPSLPDKGSESMEKPATTADLENENRRLKEERTCKICMDNEIGVVFLPCGHLICCYQCAPALTTCPLCRQPIHGTVKTYMS